MALLWLWCRPAAAAPSLELSYASGMALKRQKKIFFGKVQWHVTYSNINNYLWVCFICLFVFAVVDWHVWCWRGEGWRESGDQLWKC